jgi:hypothetical protein
MSPDKLKKSAKDLLLSQVNKPKDLIIITSDIKYKVKEIVAV